MSGEVERGIDPRAEHDLRRVRDQQRRQYGARLLDALLHVLGAALRGAADAQLPVVRVAHGRGRLGRQRPAFGRGEVDASAGSGNELAQAGELGIGRGVGRHAGGAAPVVVWTLNRRPDSSRR